MTDVAQTAVLGAANVVASGSPDVGSEALVRTRTLVFIRWIAVLGQLITVLVTRYHLGFALPVAPMLGIILASALVNSLPMLRRVNPARLEDRDATLYLGFDLIQLSALLFLTGGLQNPFAILLLAPLTVGATVLRRRSVKTLTAMVIMCVSVLGLLHLPLPWNEHTPLVIPQLYAMGQWVALTLAAVFIADYTHYIATEQRRIEGALVASRLALAREQKLSALGALAAAAAHELGTPLNTIVVIAKELKHEVPEDSPFIEDIDLLVSQSARCRTILTELARDPTGEHDAPYDRLGLPALIEAAAVGHRLAAINLRIDMEGPEDEDDLDDDQVPVMARRPEVIHGLGNILQNAFQFAESTVTATAHWTRTTVTLAITDDGPGFPPTVLSRIGEPYISQRSTTGQNMGLGIFIAQTLLERSGATVTWSNHPGGGAKTVISWPRTRFA